MRRFWLAIVPMLAVLAVSGCAEDGLGMGVCGNGVVDPFETCDDGNTQAGDGCSDACTIEGADLIVPTLHSIQQKIFTPLCTPCHWSPGSQAQWLPLNTEDVSYENLVRVESIFCFNEYGVNLRRVEPGNPGASCLVLSIEGSFQSGSSPMPPPPRPPLTAEQSAAIRQWILDGAPR